MKTVPIVIVHVVVIAVMSTCSATVGAQPAKEPTATSGELAPSGGEPVPPDVKTAPSDAEPAALDQEPIVIDDPDKPWNRDVSAESRQAARELFLEGNRRFRIPLFTKAAEKYEAALAKWKHPAFYFNLALAQLNLGLEVEARENLDLALRYGEEPLGREQFQEAERQLGEVERRLGRIRVMCQTKGAEVALNGVKLFTGPGSYEGWAKARTHEITARSAGYLSQTRSVTVSSGRLLEVELRLVTLSEATDASRRWASWKPWAVIGSGVVIAAVGGLSHRLSFGNFESFDSEFRMLPCAAPTRGSRGCTGRQVDTNLDAQLGRAERQQIVAVSSYVAGGALMVTGAILLYLNRPRLGERMSDRLNIQGMTINAMSGEGLFGFAIHSAY